MMLEVCLVQCFCFSLCSTVLSRDIHGEIIGHTCFYPALIAINYLMLDTGGRLFKIVTQASYEEALQSSTLMLTSAAIHTVSLLLRLLFWIGAWLVLRRFLEKFRPI